MEAKNVAPARSLPPLVEGKVHGYLRLVIDEIVWCRRSPGDVTVLASWWGELDSAQFRPADIKSGDIRPDEDITETYSIRTNLDLFEEYLRNCETMELVVVSEKTHQVVGTAQVAELCNLMNGKSYFQYVPIVNDSGSRIGDIHATMKLLSVPKSQKSLTKTEASKKKQFEHKILPDDRNIFQDFSTYRLDTNEFTKNAFLYDNDVPVAIKNAKQNENIYRSILKDRRLDSGSLLSGVNDKLVAQVVARAQRLRGAILRESRDDDPLVLSEGSTIDSYRSGKTADKEATLYEYFLGKKMTRNEEKKALEALRSTSPTPSLIDLAAETIRSCRSEKNPSITSERKPTTRSSKIVEDFSPPETASTQPKRLDPIDYVDSLRIAVESLSLSPAGYRRVRSSCLSRGDGIPISVTYFVQYDAMFGGPKKFNRKIINESKPVKLCSKKQVGQVVYFNHEAVYDLPKTYLHMDVPLKFKIFNRHLNQRTPTELGVGSIYVGDAARANSLSSTQRLAIVNKGIKIGELKVTAELGCDRIHFGKQFVEAVTSAKENIPVLEVSSSSSLATERHRTATGDDEQTGAKAAFSAGNRAESSWSENVSARAARETQETQRQSRQNPTGDGEIEAGDPRREPAEKVLLHGLIYVAEGKDLASTSSYLICRAFWREDRAASRICDDTNNPFYHFHQLVPLIHGADLLERTKDNCIVVEVYSRNSTGVDSLLGISKLPVHQLYVAYRDPQVLPHLLRSKYPVISVDGWVSIADPVTGRNCGQLLALVALGTADQIALLEMTRGLRDSTVTPRTIRNFVGHAAEACHSMRNERHGRNAEDEAQPVRDIRQGRYEASQPPRRGNDELYGHENFYSERSPDDGHLKTQECQTEITTVKYFKPRRVEEELANENPQSQVLNAIVDRLAQALNVPKQSADQAAQTEVDLKSRDAHEKETKSREIEPLNLGPSPSHSFSEDSDCSQRDNFHLSTEIYRSVGVGAEFDEATNQGPSTSYATGDSVSFSGFPARNPADDVHATNLPNREVMERNSAIVGFDGGLPTTVSSSRLPSTRNEKLDSESSDVENSDFRAVVEIECALHLPKVERADDAVEPCTYVTFQKARSSGDSQYGSYVVTNLCPFSCNPKWDWRCDTKLPNDLLDNEEKRLILKVWRLVDPETSMQIDLERDVVIGFSAIDVSVLTVGFPVVSGWFHVMDFTGKCNGQIKVSVTPLDNISALGKSTGAVNTARPPLPDFDHSNFSSPYPADLQNNTNAVGVFNSARNNVEEIVTSRGQVDNEPTLDIGLGLGDASMSFLSLSLKQKLTELDEIKKRLQSRLHDVTNTAFDDDFDNDFDAPIAESERDNRENGNATEDSRNVLRDLENWQIPRTTTENPNSGDRCAMTNGNRGQFDGENRRVVASDTNSVSLDANFTDTGYSTSSNVHSSRNASNGNRCYSEAEDNRFRTRLLSEENSNGFEVGSAIPASPNLLNGHYEAHQANQRNYRSVDGCLDFRDQSAGNSCPEDLTNGDEEAPTRGTRVHISHLLDKLTTQLTAVPPPTANQPMKRNIMDLITSLRRNNNNFPNDVKCNREVNVRTVPTQTETNYARDSRVSHLSNNSTETRENATANDRDRDEDAEIPPAKTKRRDKVSTAVREELAADESNEMQDCDELSAHLMTSNVRHMNLERILNPLLYAHLIPDVQTTANGAAIGDSPNSPGNTPEVEAIERLDTRYAENFNATINNGLSRLRNLLDAETSSRQGGNVSARSENDEVFRMTPSGVSENIDGNIDVTVIHKPCNDDLMASNSIDSTTTISLDHDMHTGTEIDDNSSLNSSETSVSAVSRQAPDGGNPVEETGPVVLKRSTDSQDSSSGS